LKGLGYKIQHFFLDKSYKPDFNKGNMANQYMILRKTSLTEQIKDQAKTRKSKAHTLRRTPFPCQRNVAN
jgi:hypothetical protein